jgi:hypothetical protein
MMWRGEGDLHTITENNNPGVRAWNLGTGKGSTVYEMIRAFSAAVGKDQPYPWGLFLVQSQRSSQACSRVRSAFQPSSVLARVGKFTSGPDVARVFCGL